jgi:hypothetical protein
MSMRMENGAARSGDRGRDAAGSRVSVWRRFLRRLGFPGVRERYEPSKYYMRGPGPKAREALDQTAAELDHPPVPES